MKKAAWNNTTIISDHIDEAVRKMKQTSAKNMTLLGSGTILTLFAEKDLIDEYQIMIDPVVLTGGTPIFQKIKNNIDLKLTATKIFKSGVILLSYHRMQK